MEKEILRDRMLGCLYGQAVGDALGLGTEFLSKDEISKYYPQGLSRYEQFIQDRHRSKSIKGAWTDDTDMMLCILDGFEEGKFNIRKIAQNFKDWFKTDPVDIGLHTYNVLSYSDYVDNPFFVAEVQWKLNRCRSAANGGIMRTSVVGLPKDITDKEIEDICRLTHPDKRCIGSCVIASRIINALVWERRNMSVEEIKEIAQKYDDRIAEWIDLAYTGDIRLLNLEDSATMGYTLRTLGAALWAYFHAADFESGLLAVVNEGGDADTNAAIACAILGAKFGYSSIPAYYINNMHDNVVYKKRVERFIDMVLNE